MNIIKWFKTRKERKLAAQRAEELRISNRLAKLEKELKVRLATETSAMLDSYCAVRNDKCSENCTHFQHGKARYWHYSGDIFPEFNESYRPPTCKLWCGQ